MRKSLTVYCSGAPNFFIYAVTKDLDTYCLINNQYWIPASIDLTPAELSVMTMVETPRMYNVQD